MLNLNRAQKLITTKVHKSSFFKNVKNILKTTDLELSIFEKILDFYLVSQSLLDNTA